MPQADNEKKAEMLEAEERAPHSAQVTPNRQDRQRDEVQEAVGQQIKEQLEAEAALSQEQKRLQWAQSSRDRKSVV